ENPGSDPVNQSHLLGKRNEDARRNEPSVTAGQPEKRFESDQLRARGAEQRLEIELEAVVVQGVADGSFELEALPEFLIELRVEHADPAAALGLALVEREVRALEQSAGV